MNQKQKYEVIEALVAFVKEAYQKGATPSEIAALPEVARVLLSLRAIQLQKGDKRGFFSRLSHRKKRIKDLEERLFFLECVYLSERKEWAKKHLSQNQ